MLHLSNKFVLLLAAAVLLISTASHEGDPFEHLDAARMPANTVQVSDITSFGAISGQDATAAIEKAAVHCSETRGFVDVPQGYWFVSHSVVLPFGCQGVLGEGAASTLILANVNCAVFTIHIKAGRPVFFFRLEGLEVSGGWRADTKASDVTESRLLLVDEPLSRVEHAQNGDGISYSSFKNLFGLAVHDIVKIDTGRRPYEQDNNVDASFSSWNIFDGLTTYIGAAGISPYSQVFMPNGSSTGNMFTNLRGTTTEALVRFEGIKTGFGDLVFGGIQLGMGRIFSAGPCMTYRRSIVINGAQVDAASTEAIKIEPCLSHKAPHESAPNNIKISGSTLGGSQPWSGMPPIARSTVSDLGESRWAAGGPVYDPGVSTKDAFGHALAVTRPIWEVDLEDGLTTLDVKVDGIVGGVDSGGVEQRFRLAVSVADNKVVILPDAAHALSAHSASSVPRGFPTITVAQMLNSTRVLVSTTYTAKADGTRLESTIVGEGGVFKILRGANTAF